MSLKPVRCFSCTKVLSSKYVTFGVLHDEDGFSEADALGELDLGRQCCTRMVLTGKDIEPEYESTLSYETSARFPRGGRTVVSKPAQAKKALPIAHLGGYEPNTEALDFAPSTLFISAASSLKSYEADDDLPNPAEWEERRRLLALIWFLTKSLIRGFKKVLWLGAGEMSATAIEYLLNLFEEHEFTLIDWHNLDNPKLRGLSKRKEYSKRLQVIQQTFTDAQAKAKSEEYEIFISEYRTATLESGQYQLKIDNDQRNQLQWYNSLLPQLALLRFQPPRIPGTTKYVVGEMFLAPWASPRNIETYIALEEPSSVVYDNYDFATHQQRMYYHNRVHRLSAWLHKTAKDDFGLDTCWDCAAESYILEQYIRTSDPQRVGSRVILDVRKQTMAISYALDPSKATTLITLTSQDEDNAEELVEGVAKLN